MAPSERRGPRPGGMPGSTDVARVVQGDTGDRRKVRAMTTAPVPHRDQVPAGSGAPHGRAARRAVGLSVGFGSAFAASVATLAIVYAVGAESAIEDTWLGALLVVAALFGLLGSFAAFVLAIAARRHEHWSWLWLPLVMFPAIVAFLVLGEALWWE